MRGLWKFAVPMALIFACSPAEDSYRVMRTTPDGDVCVRMDGNARLSPSYVSSDTTERAVEVTLKFSCGVPVTVEGMTCQRCTGGRIEADGFHQFRLPEKVSVGAERDIKVLELQWRSDDGSVEGSLRLEVDYEPAPEGC
jgi:hypothetical protein